ncbi:MAG: M14 family zinc carboxypeptidase [Planctomycetota bacterium]|nr:M14 family zinc carboxypeptidase [Planctomycetota bacterium]
MVRIDITSAGDALAVSQFGEPLVCSVGSGPTDFMVPLDALPDLERSGLKVTVLSRDLQAIVDADQRSNEQARAARGDFFAAYRTFTEINAYLDELDTAPGVPADQVTLFTVGASIQGRQIRGIRIARATQPGTPARPVLAITACQHAREWAAGSSAMWIADRLVRLDGSDPQVTGLLDRVNVHIIPIVNPDGYVHTFPTAQGGGNARLWRKNRRVNFAGSFGVDLNRNWSAGWGLPGASSSPNSDTYRGTAAFSEPESAAVSTYLASLTPLKGHVDLHTFSQLVLSPYGYTSELPARQAEIGPVTDAQLQAMAAVFGGTWIGGPANETLYAASGTAPDWTFTATGALAFTYELRDTGFYGFVLPPEQIVPAAREAYAGILALADHIVRRLTITVPSPPTALLQGNPTNFAVRVDLFNQYTLAPGGALLRWRTDGSGPFASVPLSGGPVTFTAVIPPQPCGSDVEYFIEATANDGTVVVSPAVGVYTAATPPCPACPGDADGNRFVDFGDISAVLAAWGQSGPPGFPGDADADGTVSFSDVSAALSAWGQSCP